MTSCSHSLDDGAASARAAGVESRWTITVDSEPIDRRGHDTLLSIADGEFGTRGAGTRLDPATDPIVVAAGVYDDGTDPHLLEGPLWGHLDLPEGEASSVTGTLDLMAGVVERRWHVGATTVRTLCFQSLSRPGTMAMRADLRGAELGRGPLLHLPMHVDERAATESGVRGDRTWVTVTANHGGGITAVASQRTHREGGTATIDRLAAYRADPHRRPPHEQADAALDEAEQLGFDGLLHEQRAAWAERWDDAAVAIDGDPDLEVAVRFALYHLMASVRSTGEAAVGARGLSGSAYAGHVFWDADVFVLPVLAAVCPDAARAMLEYRIRRLEPARAAAREQGCAGARFPWESADDGRDVTPLSVIDPTGREMAILTGELEEHIVADVAWAAHQYTQWTGDEGFLDGPGRPLLTETAAYWASRAERDSDGTAHLRGVIGPDEYHEAVDDNAFTNVMARWNLRRAADLVDPSELGGPPVDDWRDVADRLVDGWDARTGRYAQFTGFDALEPLLISEIVEPPVAADLLLGHERVNSAQVIKQADVLMLHHLVPDEVEPGSLAADLDHYLPRTAHGSSLSPAIHASLLARAGRTDDALALLRMAARLDLDGLTGTTGGGLHLATLGGVWQAVAFGFAGVRVRDRVLHVDPKLPDTWNTLRINLLVHHCRVRLRLLHDTVEVDTDGLLLVALSNGEPGRVNPPGARFTRHADGWRAVGEW